MYKKVYTRVLSLKLTALTAMLMLLPTLVMAQEAAAPASPDAAAKPPVSGLLMNLPMIILFFALFYFIAIAPQRKQAKQQQEFQKSLSKGDEVVTTSGIIGSVVGLTDRIATLEVCQGTEIRVLRSQVQAKLKELKTNEVPA